MDLAFRRDVDFIDENGGGPGLRLRKTSAVKTIQIKLSIGALDLVGDDRGAMMAASITCAGRLSSCSL
ncbi:MAG TPA: hypothetical protein VII34_09300 [Pyrinomonadaceae bacterium]